MGQTELQRMLGGVPALSFCGPNNGDEEKLFASCAERVRIDLRSSKI